MSGPQTAHARATLAAYPSKFLCRSLTLRDHFPYAPRPLPRRFDVQTQTKPQWQTVLLAGITTLVLMFGAITPARAQSTYKVGQRIEVMSGGNWVEAEVEKVLPGQRYEVRLIAVDVSGAGYGPENMRPKAANAPADKRKPETQPQTAVKAAPVRQPKTVGEVYGSREPRVCEDTKAPARGAITAVLALRYLNCQMDRVSGETLYLVENVKVEVGGGIPYAAIRGQRSLNEIDVNSPVYPIRGSVLRYQCGSTYGGEKTDNCDTYNEPNATGYCYKTTFGDWKCYMSDTAGGMQPLNMRKGVAPPKS